MDSNLEFVQFKRGLSKLEIEKQLSEIIVKKLNELPNVTDIKVNPELILFVCRIIENSIDNNSKTIKLDKKQFVVSVLNKMFGYNNSELKQANDIIQFLFDTKKINKVHLFVKLKHYAWGWIKRKWL